MVGLQTKKMAFVLVLLSLGPCSCGGDMSLFNRVSLLSNFPLGMNEVREVRVSQLREIVLVSQGSQESQLQLRVGENQAAYIDVQVECSRFRKGYYFGRAAEKEIKLKAYWYGFVYREYNDGVTYGRVKFGVIPGGKVRMELRALLKEIATGKLLLVKPSVINVSAKAFIKSLSEC